MCRAHSLHHKTVAKLFCVYTHVYMQAALFLWVCACDQRDRVKPMVEHNTQSQLHSVTRRSVMPVNTLECTVLLYYKVFSLKKGFMFLFF